MKIKNLLCLYILLDFIVLEKNKYCISRSYNTEVEDIFTIFKMLKALKHIIKTELIS